MLYKNSQVQSNFLADVLGGLSLKPKRLDSKYFYDSRGSALFEKITKLDEYYLTNAEISILETYGGAMATYIENGATLIDYGCGSLLKVRTLLQFFDRVSVLIPLDISESVVSQAKQVINLFHPNINVLPIVADFTKKVEIGSTVLKGSQLIAFFPGSTIGNFMPNQVNKFLKLIAKTIGNGGLLIVGVDLKKDSQIIQAAYNDKKGVTASFNKNILSRINIELNANFNLKDFDHVAFYDGSKGRVEMHLRSKKKQTINIGEFSFNFKKDEMIHTENSYKYTVTEFTRSAEKAGFDPMNVWVDREKLFSVHLLKANL